MTDRSFWRRFAAALTHTGPSYQLEPLPRRGDQFEQWLKAHRDRRQERDGVWWYLDEMLDDYRLHADTGTPLDQHCCENGNVDDCAGCHDQEQPCQHVSPAYNFPGEPPHGGPCIKCSIPFDPEMMK